MKPESPSKRGFVFISYRRSDSAGYAGRLREGLAKKFKVWQDLESIDLGTEFSAAIRHAISSSSVLLAVVGPEWLQAKDADGQMRLSNPKDYVRIEIQIALEQEIRVIPVLVGGVRMPAAHDLPDALQGFAGLQAHEMADPGWDYGLRRLVAAIRPVVDPWFFIRRVLLGLVAVAVVIGGTIMTKQVLEHWRREDAITIAGAGRVDDGLRILKGLEDENPRTYLYEAEIYLMKGDAFLQHDAAEKAAEFAKGDNFVLGRARGLACDAKGKMGLADEAIRDCETAEPYSIAANDLVGQIRAINFKANILKDNKPDDAMKFYKDAMGKAQEKSLIDQYGALFNIGLILAESKDPKDREQASINIEAAKKGFEDKGELGEVSSIYSQLGALKFDKGKTKLAGDDFRKALDLAVKAKDRNREAQARANLGLFLERTGSLEDAETELAHALEIYEELTGNSGTGEIADVTNSLGDLYLQQGRYDKARKAYGNAERMRSALHQTGLQASSAASLVNLDLQEGKSTTTELLKRIEATIDQASSGHDDYSQSSARIIKARVLLAQDKVAAEKEAREALQLADDDQAENAFSAQIVLAQIEAMNGHTDAALDQLKKLQDSADSEEEDVGESLEAQLTKLKVMKESGSAKQRSDAQVLLPDFQQRAEKQGYKLLAAKAQAILAGKR